MPLDHRCHLGWSNLVVPNAIWQDQHHWAMSTLPQTSAGYNFPGWKVNGLKFLQYGFCPLFTAGAILTNANLMG
jgi:hypothetical protein